MILTLDLDHVVKMDLPEKYPKLRKQYKCFLCKSAGYGVRTHAHLCAEDLKSSPLTSRANQLGH